MSEKAPGASPGKAKSNEWFNTVRVEGGSLATGAVAGGLGYLLLKMLGVASGGALLLGTALAAVGGYSFFKNAHG